MKMCLGQYDISNCFLIPSQVRRSCLLSLAKHPPPTTNANKAFPLPTAGTAPGTRCRHVVNRDEGTDIPLNHGCGRYFIT